MNRLTARIKSRQSVTAHIKQQKITATVKTGGQADQRIDYQSTDFKTLLKLQTGITYENTNQSSD